MVIDSAVSDVYLIAISFLGLVLTGGLTYWILFHVKHDIPQNINRNNNDDFVINEIGIAVARGDHVQQDGEQQEEEEEEIEIPDGVVIDQRGNLIDQFNNLNEDQLRRLQQQLIQQRLRRKPPKEKDPIRRKEQFKAARLKAKQDLRDYKVSCTTSQLINRFKNLEDDEVDSALQHRNTKRESSGASTVAGVATATTVSAEDIVAYVNKRSELQEQESGISGRGSNLIPITTTATTVFNMEPQVLWEILRELQYNEVIRGVFLESNEEEGGGDDAFQCGLFGGDGDSSGGKNSGSAMDEVYFLPITDQMLDQLHRKIQNQLGPPTSDGAAGTAGCMEMELLERLIERSIVADHQTDASTD